MIRRIALAFLALLLLGIGAVDSIDVSAFLLGESGTSRRESLLCFIGEERAALERRQSKMHVREYSVEPNTWIGEPVFHLLTGYLKSATDFPNIPTGGTEPVAGTGLGRPIIPRS